MTRAAARISDHANTSVRVVQNHLEIAVEIAGTRGWLIFDTGNTSLTYVPRRMAESYGWLKGSKGAGTIHGRGVTQSAELDAYVVPSLKVALTSSSTCHRRRPVGLPGDAGDRAHRRGDPAPLRRHARRRAAAPAFVQPLSTLPPKRALPFQNIDVRGAGHDRAGAGYRVRTGDIKLGKHDHTPS